MIVINVRFTVKPEYRDSFLDKVADFTAATRAEPGNLWFDWSRSVDDPNVFVLIEAFTDGDAPGEHVNSQHFKTAMRELPALLAATPDIINVQVPGETWSKMGELSVD